MRLLRARSGGAAVEFAMVAPVMLLLLMVAIDFGAYLLYKARVTRALANSAEYAILAGQANTATATIITNAKTFAGAITSTFLGPVSTTAVVNNSAATGSKCCPPTPGAAPSTNFSWNCSTSTTFSCPDGSTPGSFIIVTANYPFKPVFSTNKYLVGKVLTGAVVAPVQ